MGGRAVKDVGHVDTVGGLVGGWAVKDVGLVETIGGMASNVDGVSTCVGKTG